MSNLTPDGFRTAAYLAAKARMDARKTARNVQCNPPNVRCGNRCIPPTWDCRLKGQGTDPHLRAVKTDPLGGFANIQRGITRTLKGVTKGNFSEVEGGKRAVIRGAVKITPGNLQQKKELQRKLEDRTRSIGIGLAVITGGLGIHALLMKSNTFGYREGVGADINGAVRRGVSRVLDSTPIVGQNRARVRATVASGIQSELARASNPVEAQLTGQLARTTVSSADQDARSNLVKALQRVDEENRGSNASFDKWNREHQRAFFTVTKVEPGVGLPTGGRASIFARPATDEYLARQFNLNGADALTTKSIKSAIEVQLTEYKSSLLDLAQQQGFKVKNVAGGRVLEDREVRPFIQGLVSSTYPHRQANDAMRRSLTLHLEDTLTLNPKARTNKLYRDTFSGFNDFYTEQAATVTNVAEAGRFSRAMRQAGAEQSVLDGAQVRAQYLLGTGPTRPTTEIQGSAHAELVLRDHHARVTGTGPRRMFTITDRLAVAAASELEGRPVRLTEAFSVLEREGFTGVVRRGAPRARTRTTYSGEAVYQLMRENPGMTLQAARAEIKRRRGDSPEDDIPVRVRTYLVARADFKEGSRLGKPCGESHIPKAHECRKGQGQIKPEVETTDPRTSNHSKKAKLAVAAGLAVIGALGVTVAFDINRLNKGSGLAAPPSFRKVISQIRKENPSLDTGAALESYYDSVVKAEGWKPGQLVYTRYTGGKVVLGGNEDHYAVYIGKLGGTHHFGSYGGDTNGVGSATLENSGSGGNFRPFIYAKVPEMKGGGTGNLDEKQLRYRVFKSLEQPMRYDMLENNCEAWARMIVEGTPRSTQSDRISIISKTLYRLDSIIGRKKLEGHISIKQEAKRLDLIWRKVNGDTAAVQELAAFTAMLNKGSRKDAAANVAGLPEPNDILHKGLSEQEVTQRVKMYLMLAVSTAQAAKSSARKDSLALIKLRTHRARAGSARTGKPCGESFIPKTHECRQQRKAQLVKAAVAAGVVATGLYGLRKAKLNEFHTGITTQDVLAPVRKRRFNWMQEHQALTTSADIANAFEGLKSQKGVVPQNVEALQTFVKQHGIVNNPSTVFNDIQEGLAKTSIAGDATTLVQRAKIMVNLGSTDGLASPVTNNIFVRSSRKNPAILAPDPAEMVATGSRFMDRRAAAVGDQKPGLNERFQRLFSASRNTADGDTREAMLHIHEIAHKVHFEATLKKGGSIETMLRDSYYDPMHDQRALESIIPSKQRNSKDFAGFYEEQQQRQRAIKAELKAAVSEYGRSDITRSRAETFAELSTLYIVQGTRLKKDFPLAYAWVDQIWSAAND